MLENLVKHPLALATLGGLLTLGGGWMRDRITMESRESSNAVQIETVKADVSRVEGALRLYVTKEEFVQFSAAMLRSAEMTRDELREIKAELRRR